MKESDDQKRVEVAQEWPKLFKAEIKSEEINCEGCQSDGGRLFDYYEVCELSKCGEEKVLS
jgi:hypothetical protein